MALTTQQRKDILRDIAERLSSARLNWPLNKVDTQAAIDAIDDFLDANATAINQAFPTAARTALSVGQKAAVVGYVALKRNGVV